MPSRATKIVVTLGPASSDPVLLEKMIRAGVNVVRLNFSHGTAQDHRRRLGRSRHVAAFSIQEEGKGGSDARLVRLSECGIGGLNLQAVAESPPLSRPRGAAYGRATGRPRIRRLPCRTS